MGHIFDRGARAARCESKDTPHVFNLKILAEILQELSTRPEDARRRVYLASEGLLKGTKNHARCVHPRESQPPVLVLVSLTYAERVLHKPQGAKGRSIKSGSGVA